MAKKTLFLFLFIMSSFIVTYFLYDPILKYIEIDRQVDTIKNTTWDLFTGNVVDIFSWDNSVYTGSENNSQATDWDKYQTYVESNKFRIYHPKKQPVITSTDYNERSNILNDYLTKNNFYFRLNDQVNTWYLYIKLKSPTKNDVFLYRHNSNDWNGYQISWKIRKDSNLLEWVSDEFLFPLNKIPIVTYYKQKNKDYNWQVELNKNQLQFIWWYVVWFDWNQIEEIVIAWE